DVAMATQAYRLTFVLRLTGSDAGTTQQTVTIAAPSTDEALELAQFYRPTDANPAVQLSNGGINFTTAPVQTPTTGGTGGTGGSTGGTGGSIGGRGGSTGGTGTGNTGTGDKTLVVRV
ncbi:hypothetical protein MKK84_06820, partial [Methylobacterium sp. E-065]|uniref:hypothetical protein n=1 Tax=Methylobacterium sp. E-065 TaxID=2836583 RepID=UPI001FB92971